MLYVLGNALLLLNRGVYWDGRYYFHLLENKQWNILWEHLSQVGWRSLYFELRFFELTPNPILIFKFVVFLSWLVSGLAIYKILRDAFELREEHAFYISALYLLSPAFLVRAELSIIPYTLGSMLFFLAMLAFFAAERQGSLIKYAASLILFFLSFSTNSLLVFYVGFLVLLFYRRHESFFKWLKNYFFFAILPIIYWGVQWYYLQPAINPHYNDFIFFKPDVAPRLIEKLWDGIFYGFFWPLMAPITILQRKIFAGLFAIVLVMVYVLTKRFLQDNNREEKAGASEKPWRYVMVGTFLFFLGLAPYLMVGKAPSIFGPGFTMRHALLLPLGSSLIILGIILSAIREQWQRITQVIILTLFCTFSIYTYFTLDMDWYKQKAVVRALASTPELQQASTIIINDNIRGFEFQNRTILDFEYQTYVNEAFSQEHFKFVIRGNGNVDENNINQMVQEKYLAFLDAEMFPVPPNFDPLTKPVSIEIVSRATEEIYTVPKWLRLKYYELFLNNALFSQKLADELQIVVQLPIVVSRKINVAN